MLVFFMLAISSIAFAEDEYSQSDLYELEQLSLESIIDLPLTSIASGYEMSTKQAPAVVTIITNDTIKAMGAVTINEVLESVAGIHMTPSPLSRLIPGANIRGLFTSLGAQTLFLMDGYPLKGNLYFPSFLAKMNIENISRIEVIKGPGSAIYGSDAMNGVVNIITKSANEINGLNVGGRIGSNDLVNTWFQTSGKLINDFDIAFSLELAKENADRSRIVESDMQTTFDSMFGTNASQAPGYIDERYKAANYNLKITNNQWSFGLSGYVLRDRGMGAGFAQAIEHEGYDDYDQVMFTTGYKNNNLHKDLELNVIFSYEYSEVKSHLVFYPPGTSLPVGPDGIFFSPGSTMVTFSDGVIIDPGTKAYIPQLETTLLFSGIRDHILRFNTGVRMEKATVTSAKNNGYGVIDNSQPVIDGTLTDVTGTPYIYAENEKRTISFLSLQDTWSINNDLTLTTGVRYDHYSDFGDTVNPRIALVWNTNDKLTTKFLYGSAFRAPSFNELYAKNNPASWGNPNLGPEEIDTYEMVFDYQFIHNFQANLNIYHYDASDVIEFIKDSNQIGTAQNVKSLEGNGFELTGNWAVNENIDLVANYTYQSTKDKDTHDQEAFVPIHQAYIDGRWRFDKNWQISSQLRWIGERERVEGDSRDDLDDYIITDMALRRTNIKENWEAAISVKNLFDENAYEPSDGRIPGDYPLNERSAFIEVRYKH